MNEFERAEQESAKAIVKQAAGLARCYAKPQDRDAALVALLGVALELATIPTPHHNAQAPTGVEPGTHLERVRGGF